MNDVFSIDFTRAMPPTLRNDPAMLALGQSIAGELQENIRLASLTLIFHRIDELDENVLDILARDMHVDWWDDSHPIEVKRRILRDSVRVHMRLGTRFAIETPLRNIFPNSNVQEWFEYGGTHHRFRIHLNVSDYNMPIDIGRVLWAVNFYKRLTAHLDDLSYYLSLFVRNRNTFRFHNLTIGLGAWNITRPRNQRWNRSIRWNGKHKWSGETIPHGIIMSNIKFAFRIWNVTKPSGTRWNRSIQWNRQHRWSERRTTANNLTLRNVTFSIGTSYRQPGNTVTLISRIRWNGRIQWNGQYKWNDINKEVL